MTKAIEPDIQEAIIDALPNDYDQAMEVICQLIANMMLSGSAPWDWHKVTSKIKFHLAEYEGT